jgi:hypothetical protein
MGLFAAGYGGKEVAVWRLDGRFANVSMSGKPASQAPTREANYSRLVSNYLDKSETDWMKAVSST